MRRVSLASAASRRDLTTHSHPFQVIIHRIIIESRNARVGSHVGMSERPADLVVCESFAVEADSSAVVERDGGRRSRGEHVAERVCAKGMGQLNSLGREAECNAPSLGFSRARFSRSSRRRFELASSSILDLVRPLSSSQ